MYKSKRLSIIQESNDRNTSNKIKEKEEERQKEKVKIKNEISDLNIL
jgi:hypothetical protein